MKTKTCIAILLGCIFSSTYADTKLTTLPPREEVRIDLANSSQGLVEEDRTINIVKGYNHVDFSWAGTYIQKESIQIRALTTPGELRILSVSFPPGQNALFWDIWSEKSGPAKFRISYLISGFTKKTDYLAIAAKDEKSIFLESRVNIGNQTGENFDNSDIQLGKVFTYKDREMLNNQVRKMVAFRGKNIPLTKEYVYNPQQGSDVRFFYTFVNKPTGDNSYFGKDTLEAGKTRVYIQDSEKSETFLGEDWGKATPVGRTASLFMGMAKDVKCEYHLMKDVRENVIWNRWYHMHRQGKWTLQNFKDGEVTLTIEQPMSGEWTTGKIVLKEESGERDKKQENEISLDAVKVTRENNDLLRIEVKLPNTGKKKIKWNLYVDWTLHNLGF